MERVESTDQKEDLFTVFVPNVVDVLEKAGEDPEASRSIGGYCSTEDLDRQGEIVVAKGLDFSEFVNFGWFNDNHKQDTSATLGYPRLARLEKGRWWTEGNLIPGYPPADQIWSLAKSLQRSGSSRRLGFSIEGKVLQRDFHNKILKAKVRNVAITNVPVNTSCTWSVLVKSFAGPEEIEQASEKSLAAGYQHPATVGGAALRIEDLEKLQRRKNGERLSRSEVFRHVRHRWPHLSDYLWRRVTSYVMAQAKAKE